MSIESLAELIEIKGLRQTVSVGNRRSEVALTPREGFDVDLVLGVLGLLFRVPFFLVGAAFVFGWTLVVIGWGAVVTAWYWIVVPVGWVVTMPLRLFAVPFRRGVTQQLQRQLASEKAAWREKYAAATRKLDNQVRPRWRRLLKFLVEGSN